MATSSLPQPVLTEDATAGPASFRVVALLNATAGTVARRTQDSLRETLASDFASRGVSATLDFIAGDGLKAAAERARLRAEKGDIDAVVVGGGDGSIRTVAGVLAGTAIPLGVLPLGTLNHFSKDVGIPQDLARAVEVIAAGHAEPVDVAEVNGEVFVNNSSIGIYPYMVVDRERRRAARGQDKWVAMIFAWFRALRYLPLRRLTISAEGWTKPYRTPSVFIGNNEYQLAGRSLGTRERLDRGELCLYVARQRSRMALVWVALKSALGFLDQSRDLRTLKGASATISSRTSRLLVAVDGEVQTMRPPLRYRSRPGALRVLVPRRTAD
jgi:diacylglycerol kinase family enzyme